MAPFTPARRVGIPAAALVLALSGSLIPVASTIAAITNPASGGAVISADQFGTANFTSVTGPAIAETAPGELALGTTTILNIPAGFRFHAGVGTLSIGGTGCDLKGTLGTSETQSTFTVTQASTVAGCIAMFVGLEVQPTAGVGLTTGNITKTGTSAAPAGATNYGTLTKVAGKLSQLIYLTQPSAANSGGIAFGTQPVLLARDQFGNNVSGARVTLSIMPGTGPKGAHFKCATNPVASNVSGVVDFTGAGCRIDKVGKYRLRATSGSVKTNSGTFQVNVGPATRLIFLAYPTSTTKRKLNAQPKVAVVDAGGNVVKSFAPTGITIAINKHANHFSCIGGLTATTVSGVATFRGCKEMFVTSKYRLTAWVGFANITGKMFRVKK